jgi:hypothetical protein
MGEINNELLLATDNENTIFHMPANKGNLDIFLNVWVLAQENLNKKEINYKVLLATDNE